MLVLKMSQINRKTRLQCHIYWQHLCFSKRLEKWFFAHYSSTTRDISTKLRKHVLWKNRNQTRLLSFIVCHKFNFFFKIFITRRGKSQKPHRVYKDLASFKFAMHLSCWRIALQLECPKFAWETQFQLLVGRVIDCNLLSLCFFEIKCEISDNTFSVICYICILPPLG